MVRHHSLTLADRRLLSGISRMLCYAMPVPTTAFASGSNKCLPACASPSSLPSSPPCARRHRRQRHRPHSARGAKDRDAVLGARHHQGARPRPQSRSADRAARARLDRSRQDRPQGRLGRHDAVGLAVGRARAHARRQPGVLSVVDRRSAPSWCRRGSPISEIAHLKGRKLAIAGGPLDKSWLLLQALARRSGVDLRRQATIVYGAPPLLSEKALQREQDATLTFWNFCADLEGKGFRRAIAMDGVMKRPRRQRAGCDRRLYVRRYLGGPQPRRGRPLPRRHPAGKADPRLLGGRMAAAGAAHRRQ